MHSGHFAIRLEYSKLSEWRTTSVCITVMHTLMLILYNKTHIEGIKDSTEQQWHVKLFINEWHTGCTQNRLWMRFTLKTTQLTAYCAHKECFRYLESRLMWIEIKTRWMHCWIECWKHCSHYTPLIGVRVNISNKSTAYGWRNLTQ